MKKSEKIEIGKTCAYKVLNEGKSYDDLEFIIFNGENFSKDILKKYIALYIENESKENPENPIISQYEKHRATALERTSFRITLANIMRSSVEEFKESLPSLTDNQIASRLRALKKGLQDEPEKAAVIYGYIATIEDLKKEKTKANEKTSSRGIFEDHLDDIIDLYLSSDVINPAKLRIDPKIMPTTTFVSRLKDVEEDIKNGGTKYPEDVKTKVRVLDAAVTARQRSVKDLIIQVSDYILNGINKSGRNEPFTMFDYYSLTRYSVDDLAKTALNLSRGNKDELQGCATILASYRDRVFKSDRRITKEQIMQYQYTENGRILFSDEVDDIIAYLAANNIPLTQKTYQGAYHEYVNGRLQIKHIWIKQ